MIDITKLTEEDVGRGVVYKNFDGKYEDGIITSWNDKYIFVQYKSNYNSSATYPEDLESLK